MCAAISAQEKLQAAMQNKIVPNQVRGQGSSGLITRVTAITRARSSQQE